jgi:hypothetical protein
VIPDQEIREAAERVVRADTDPLHVVYGLNGVHALYLYEQDCRLLAYFVLDEMPADDAESVTAEWMEAVGGQGAIGYRMEDRTRYYEFSTRTPGEMGYLGVCVWGDAMGWWLQTSDNDPDLRVSGLAASGIPLVTRGDLRRLCAALGVPLKESK